MPSASMPAFQRSIICPAKPAHSASPSRKRFLHSHSSLSCYRISRAVWPYLGYLCKRFLSRECCWDGALSIRASQGRETREAFTECLSYALPCSECRGYERGKTTPPHMELTFSRGRRETNERTKNNMCQFVTCTTKEREGGKEDGESLGGVLS